MRRIPLLGVALLFACLVFGCSGDQKEAGQPDPNAGQQGTAQSGDNAAVAAAWTATDTRGNTQLGSQWVGKQPTVINIWGTWCPPCRQEIPDLVRLYNEYNPKGVEILGFAVKDQPAQVQIFANEAGMGWVMLMGNDEVLEKYGPITGVPTTIFLDKNGTEVTRFIGAQSYEKFKTAFDAILQGYGGVQSSTM